MPVMSQMSQCAFDAFDLGLALLSTEHWEGATGRDKLGFLPTRCLLRDFLLFSRRDFMRFTGQPLPFTKTSRSLHDQRESDPCTLPRSLCSQPTAITLPHHE
jgi:hypothetical protein